VRAHPNARLDATEKAELIRGLTSTLAQAGHGHSITVKDLRTHD
jgi:hypothetical protein